MMVASPRETPPKKRWPAATSSPGAKVSPGGGAAWGTGWTGAGCARTGELIRPTNKSSRARLRKTAPIGTPLVDGIPLNPLHTGMGVGPPAKAASARHFESILGSNYDDSAARMEVTGRAG